MPSISARRFVFTLNNPVRDDIPCDWFVAGDVVFVAWQLEAGANGTPHLQGYFVTKTNPRNKNGYTLKWCKETLNSKMHIELAHGTHDQCVDYCCKEETRIEGPWILGEWEPHVKAASQGRATQKKVADEVKQRIIDGATDGELWQEYFTYMTIHHKAMNTFRLSLSAQERNWHTRCAVFVGPPGTGKSKEAKAFCDALGGGFWLRKPKFGGNAWFDGLDPNKHKVLVLDEFDGSWMPFEELLRICDRYPHQLEAKGTMLQCLFEWVVITSNKAPRDWYTLEAVDDNRWQAFVRRMSGKCGFIRRFSTVIPEEEFDDTDAEALYALRIAGQPVFAHPSPNQDDDDGDGWEDDLEGVSLDGSKEGDYEETSGDYEEPDPDEYEQERYMAPTASLGRSGTLSGGVIDNDTVEIQSPEFPTLKRSDTSTFGIERVYDKRVGKGFTQQKILFRNGSKKRQLETDPDEDFDDK